MPKKAAATAELDATAEDPVPNRKPEVLDATKEGLGPPQKPEVADYNPAKDREIARRRLAYFTLGLLWLVVTSLFFGDFMHWISLGEAKDLATAILAPVVVLVGTVIGFYFGGDQR
ncbi:MAG TPA: hypothetical protein VNB59_05565 [Solirubrobacterales bacterium]|jgi:hypothetical protein|nr:hypothetical protein [Solirubrobacterales bacterium]